jgi:hypothetical protein
MRELWCDYQKFRFLGVVALIFFCLFQEQCGTQGESNAGPMARRLMISTPYSTLLRDSVQHKTEMICISMFQYKLVNTRIKCTFFFKKHFKKCELLLLVFITWFSSILDYSKGKLFCKQQTLIAVVRVRRKI